MNDRTKTHPDRPATNPTGPGPLPMIMVGITLLVLVVVIGVVALQAGASGPGDAAAPGQPAGLDPPPEGLEVLPFEGVDQLGRPVDESVLDGSYTVVSFGFTNCTLACPIMHGNMFTLTKRLANTPVRFLTISVDPVHDTVEQLKAYSDRLEADPERWRFVRTDAETSKRLVEQGLRMGLEEDPATVIELPGGGSMVNIIHPTRFVIVGPDGEVAGLYPGMSPEGVDELVRDLRAELTG